LIALGLVVGMAARIWIAGRDLREARAALQRRNVEQAVAAFRRHLERCPRDDPVRLELGLALESISPEEALVEFRAIPVDAPEIVAAARHVAAINLNLHRDYDALQPLLFLKERLPNDAGVELSLAEIAFRDRRFMPALEGARRCRQLRPELTEAYLLEADCLDELQRPAEMIEPLEAVLQLDPELPAARLNLAYACQLTGRTADAREHIQWYLARHPNSAPAHRILALVERDRGRLADALAAVQRALRLEPHALEAGLLEAELLLALGRGDEAYQRVTDLAAYFGDEQRLLTLRIRAASASGRTEEADDLQQRLKRLMAYSEP
jgi:Flp pilus assembly protein TadD